MSELKVTPRGKFCYCQISKLDEVTNSGGVIIIPGDRSEGTRLAKVLVKGPDVSADIEIGDVYAVQFFAGTPLNLAEFGLMDGTHKLISESELMSKVEEIESGDA